MRTVAITVLGAALLTGSVFAGPETIIKQRAKELRDQNNVRQGVTPPAQAPQPAAPGNSAATAASQGLGRLQAELAAIKVGSQPTAEQKQKISRGIIASAMTTKPSEGSAAKLADDLASALSQKQLSSAERGRLIQDLNGALNGAKLSMLQRDNIVSDVQAIFQVNGLNRNTAATIASDVKAIALEVQRGAAK